MIIFPALDLIAGKVVRLEQGRRDRMRVYSDNPVEVALAFRDAGAKWIHVVDLSATFEEDEAACEANLALLREVCTIEGLSVDCGGGVRSLAQLERLIDAGAKRISLGTALVRDSEFAAQAARDYKDFVVADIAAKEGSVRINGWREEQSIALEELVEKLLEYGFKHLVFTDIARDGMQTGINPEPYKKLAAIANFPVVASGGIASLADITRLRELGDVIIEGCIVGRALYEGAFTLEEALREGRAESSC